MGEGIGYLFMVYVEVCIIIKCKFRLFYKMCEIWDEFFYINFFGKG